MNLENPNSIGKKLASGLYSSRGMRTRNFNSNCALLLVTAFLASSCSIRDRKLEEPLITDAGEPRILAHIEMPTEPPSELKPIFFETNKSELNADAQAAIRENAAWLKAHPSYRIQIEGNCDNRGSVAHNILLGVKRADSARKSLVDNGVEPDRIVVLSFGKIPSGPVNYNNNRRAAFKVYDPNSTN